MYVCREGHNASKKYLNAAPVAPQIDRSTDAKPVYKLREDSAGQPLGATFKVGAQYGTCRAAFPQEKREGRQSFRAPKKPETQPIQTILNCFKNSWERRKIFASNNLPMLNDARRLSEVGLKSVCRRFDSGPGHVG